MLPWSPAVRRGQPHGPNVPIGNAPVAAAPAPTAAPVAPVAAAASELKEVQVPDIGGDTDVDVIELLVAVGDEIEEEAGLITLETDKATMEFESFQSGTLLYIGIQEGESAKVDSVLAIIGDKGTDVSKMVASLKNVDVIFTALPNGEAQNISKSLLKKK